MGCFLVICFNATSQEQIIVICVVSVSVSILGNILLIAIFPVAFQFLLGVWAKDLNSREDHVKRSVQGKLASATHSQTESYLKPLFRKLRKKVTFVQIVKQGAKMLFIGCGFKFFISNSSNFSIISSRVYQLTSKSQSQTSLNSCWRENMLRCVVICITVF